MLKIKNALNLPCKVTTMHVIIKEVNLLEMNPTVKGKRTKQTAETTNEINNCTLIEVFGLKTSKRNWKTTFKIKLSIGK